MIPDLNGEVELVGIDYNEYVKKTFIELLHRDFGRVIIWDSLTMFFSAKIPQGYENGTILHPNQLPGILIENYIKTGNIKLTIKRRNIDIISSCSLTEEGWFYS